MKKLLVSSVLASLTSVAMANLDVHGPKGFTYLDGRLTLRPYVSFGYTFDSNVDSGRHSSNSSSWSVNPGINFSYKTENLKIDGAVFYAYHAYSSGASKQLNNSSYGERLGVSYSNAESGWSFSLKEQFQKLSQDDDMANDNGKGYGRDRSQVNLDGVLNKRFGESFHAGVSGGYYWLDYDNNVDHYAPLYGWSRWSVGAEIGYTLSQWTDWFVTGSYQGYRQDNCNELGSTSTSLYGNNVGRTSRGWTIHTGLQSYLTERIKYRVSGGWTVFEYGNDVRRSNGFTYTGSLNWKIGETWNMMALASAYYHPSETSYGASMRTDSVSWGITKSLVENRLRANFDLAYRHESHPHTEYSNDNYSSDILTARFGLNYTFNRWFSIYGNLEYQTSMNNGDNLDSRYDYDRWRGTVGFSFSY